MVARNAPSTSWGQLGRARGQAEFYRDEAARLRVVAASSGFGDLKTDFLRMAEQYEILARQAEVNVLLAYSGFPAATDTPNDEVASLPPPR
jgi:hypothetical protein